MLVPQRMAGGSDELEYSPGSGVDGERTAVGEHADREHHEHQCRALLIMILMLTLARVNWLLWRIWSVYEGSLLYLHEAS